MAEKFSERTAGIWVPLVFYWVGGAYMLAFCGTLASSAYHLVVLGGLSIVIAIALFLLSRWAYWLGLFTFPLMFAEFAFALLNSVNVVGWYPDYVNGAFQASMIAYLVFLVLSVLLLVDKRNTLKTDRFMDMLGRLSSSSSSLQEPKADSKAA